MAHNPRPRLDHPAGDELELTAVLHALADPTRLAIVRTLYREADGRACGTFPVDVAPSTLSHHFKVLRTAGVIFQEDHGTRRWTTLRLDDLNTSFPGLLEAVTPRK
ncbi:ArsR/SmtB family transcription factor [Rathayibacter sp. CAU 1779]